MSELGWQAWLTLVTLFGVIAVLFSGRAPSDIAALGGLGLLLVAGVLDVEKGLAGFSNTGVLTIGLLFVLAELIRSSGALEIVARRLFASRSGLRGALVRLMAPTAFVSAFLNNTPVVALLLPATKQWAEDRGFPATKVLIPLSYAAILGGTCTLIGTSTNLVVVGLMQEQGLASIGFFEIGLVGVPVALVGIAYVATIGVKLLPAPQEAQGPFDDPTTFTTEAIVLETGSLPGKALAAADVGDLNGLFPVEVRRGDAIFPAPGPEFVLEANDRLVLAGPAAQFIKLHKGADLATVSKHRFDVTNPIGSRRRVVEVVLSGHSPLVGAQVGDGTFRRHYGAAVIALSHHGAKDEADVRDWRLRVGDRILLEAGDGFEAHRDGRDFFVVNDVARLDGEPVTWRAWAALAVTGLMVSVVATGLVELLDASIAAAAALFAINPISSSQARSAIDWQVLLTIAAMFGLAAAVTQTGLAEHAAEQMLRLGGASPMIALGATYLTTVLLTEVITNNAAAALAFPLALAMAQELGVSPIPFAVAVMIAASASFLSPLGYQTNLMVYGAGRYEARDFARVGWPLAVLTAIVTIVLTPMFFPF